MLLLTLLVFMHLAQGTAAFEESDAFPDLVLVGTTAYIAWASYWGIVRTMRAVADLGERGMPTSFLGELMMRVTLKGFGFGGMLLAPFALGILYGTLGGGVREFLKYRKIAANPNVPLK